MNIIYLYAPIIGEKYQQQSEAVSSVLDMHPQIDSSTMVNGFSYILVGSRGCRIASPAVAEKPNHMPYE